MADNTSTTTMKTVLSTYTVGGLDYFMVNFYGSPNTLHQPLFFFDTYRELRVNVNFNISDDEAESLTRTYNTLNACCISLQFHPICTSSHSKNRSAFESYLKEMLLPLKFEWLAVMERSNSTVNHTHILLFSNTPFNLKSKDMKDLQNLLSNVEMKCSSFDSTDETPEKAVPVIKMEVIKSVGSYLNYLTKDVKSLWFSNQTIAKMFINFERTHIFSADSVPKFSKRNLSIDLKCDDAITITIMNLLERRLLSFQQVINHPSMHTYLKVPNLKNIYQNCYTAFVANFNHIKNLIYIVQQFNEMNTVGCMCPMMEWLDMQGIYTPNQDDHSFLETVFKWLNGIGKRNALLFTGKPNGGKSHVANLLWDCFNLNTRIIKDGIFTFANLTASGCGLWEEPFIPEDLVDTTKLVLEGNSSIDIAIKNNPSARLGKRVPIIITTNNPLHQYVSGSRDALAARCIEFTVNTTFTDRFVWCTASNHYCPYIGSACDRHNPFLRTTSADICKRRRASTEVCETCEGYHKLEKKHVLTFLTFILYRYRERFELLQDASDSEHSKLADLLHNLSNSNFCYLSNHNKLYTDL